MARALGLRPARARLAAERLNVCRRDSGGPNFLGTSNVVAAVTSFGINSNCAGTGGVFRVDRPDVLAFINGFPR